MLFVSWFCIVHSEFRIPHLAGVGMAKLSTEAKVGLLVAVGSVVLLYMTLIVGKYEFGGKKGYSLSADFESVSGLDEKAAVRMAGVKIGTVETVELIGSHARVLMRIDQDVQIRRGAEAAIKTEGLLGDKYVEIIPPSGGSGGSPVSAAPGGGAAGTASQNASTGREYPGDGIAKRCRQTDRPIERDFGRYQAGYRFAPAGFRDRAGRTVHGRYPGRSAENDREYPGIFLYPSKRRERTRNADERTCLQSERGRG